MAPPYQTPPNPVLASSFVAGQPGPAFATGPQGSIGLQCIESLISSAQLLAIFATPIALIAAPGVGFFIYPHKIVMRFIGGGVAYTDAGGGAISFGVGGLSVALASNAIILVTVSPNRRQQVLDWAAAAVGVGVTGTAANPPTEDNAPLNMSKATGSPLAGTGTMHLTTYYTVEPSV